jgi:hypothetical protein
MKEKIEKINKLIDKVARYSLYLDIGIALITTASLLGINFAIQFLTIINYMLTFVVILSIGLFAFLYYLKSKEKLLSNELKADDLNGK